MTKTPRAYRVAEQIREMIAMELLKSVDPRLTLVSLTAATVSSDLREANIYWSVFGENREKDVAAGLDAAKGHLRSVLAKKLKTRTVPNLRFFYDNTLATISEVEELMSKVAAHESSSKSTEGDE